jgi:hypothetical protein
MRNLAAFVLLVAAAGCATQTDHPEIAILRNAPTEPYVALGVVQDEEICYEASTMPNSVLDDQFSDQDNIKLEQPYGFTALRKQAAKLGAQALFLTRVRIFKPTGQRTRGNTRVLFEGIAIRYKVVQPPAIAGPAQDPQNFFRDLPFEVVHEPTPPESGSRSSLVAAPAPNTVDDKTEALAPYLVGDDHVGCFGMSLRVRKDIFTKQVATITIFEVLPNSPAEKAGLEPLTSIRQIDGRPVEEFIASFKKGSDLNRKLMRRNPGDRITLEILMPGSTVPTVVTMTEGTAKRGFEYNGSLGLGHPTIGR